MGGWLAKLGLGLKKSSQKISSGISDIFTKRKVNAETLEELEELLISADMGVQASMQIIKEFSRRKLDKELSGEEIRVELAADIAKILQSCEFPLVIDDSKKPFVILMVGVNGAGKTTSIGKLAAKFKAQGKQISFIAGDTFRAAAVEQLKVWGERNHARVFYKETGADAAGVVFDGLKEAIAQGDDIVFVDTAGRLQNKKGLMEELQKVVRVIKKIIPDAPHSTLLTIDATTGQNALAQVIAFKEMVDVNGLIVTKLDGSAKGGILAAVAKETLIPIHYIGVGEGIDDMDVFYADEFARNLLDA
ncbi:MAG: signal recognition particle-docking protein FtsY [Alphaproteobacteria bacterium]|nr:signal recognition particle-docking protein FtsY [Alphaproteobacteria bacterium]